jgi:hypothetical protein
VHLYHETQPAAVSEAGFSKTISIQPGVRSTETG